MREANKFIFSQEEFRSGLEKGMRVHSSVVVLNFLGSLFSRKRNLVHACNITLSELQGPLKLGMGLGSGTTEQKGHSEYSRKEPTGRQRKEGGCTQRALFPGPEPMNLQGLKKAQGIPLGMWLGGEEDSVSSSRGCRGGTLCDSARSLTDLGLC